MRILLVIFSILLVLINYSNCQLLEIFGLSTGEAGTREGRQPFHDLASQSAGLIHYLKTIQKNPNNALEKKLKQPLPSVNLIDGLPVVPGVLGSLPGAGSCLPRGSPLVRDRSPSFFQNIIRNIPGAQDYLASMLPSPEVEVEHLYGKYYWALDTPSVHNRFCATTEIKREVQAGRSSGFSLQEKFRTGSEDGGEKAAFGYGILHQNRTYFYMQDDPCPYQVIITGPAAANGQYEYLILSNWARFPVIGLVRDIRLFYNKYKDNLENDLEKEGFVNDYTGNSVIHYADWSKCKAATPLNYIRNVLTDLFG